MSIMAFAAVAMTMTSCNKEEAIVANNFNVTFEDSEVMNEMKTYFVGHSLYWENNDKFYIMDGSNNVAQYHIDLNANPNYIFDKAVKGNFSETNGTLTAFYPTTIVYNNRYNEVLLPRFEKSTAGEIQWPMYAQGTINDFQFRNLCGNVSLYIKGDAAIDSISITTDKYLNGHHKVNISNLTNPLSYGSGNGTSRSTIQGHGTKTNSMWFRQPLQLTNEAQLVRITVPAGDYTHFALTFYANGKKYSKTFPGIFSVGRTTYNTIGATNPIVLNNANFVDYIPGALNGQFNVAAAGEAPHYVVFSQGNLEYLPVNQKKMWYLADNQWDFRGVNQKKCQSQYDRDLFAWGANGYYDGSGSTLRGNGITIWGDESNHSANVYDYCKATELTSNNEWGYNKIVNGGNSVNSGWRTLTPTEMTNLLTNYHYAMVNLQFNGKTGMIIFADGVTPVANGTTLSKTEWNTLMNEGCIFFLADTYRTQAGNTDNTQSIFWLNYGCDANYASGLVVNKVTGPSVVTSLHKSIGGFVRLVKDVQ